MCIVAVASGKIAEYPPVPGRARNQGGVHRRSSGIRTHGGHRALFGRGSFSQLPPAALGEKSLWLHERGGRVRDECAGHGGSDQSFRSVPGRTPTQRFGQRHRCAHGRNPPLAGGSAGAGLHHVLRPTPAYSQRHRLQPSVVDHRCAFQTGGAAVVGSGYICQCRRRDEDIRTSQRPGYRRGDYIQCAQQTRGGRSGVDRRSGLERGIALGEPIGAAVERSSEVRIQTGGGATQRPTRDGR